VTGRERLTCDQERRSSQDDADIPQAPEIGLIEQYSCVREFPKLVVSEAGEPDIQKDLGHGHVLWISLNKYCIVQDEKDNKEERLKAFLELWNSQPGIWISGPTHAAVSYHSTSLTAFAHLLL